MAKSLLIPALELAREAAVEAAGDSSEVGAHLGIHEVDPHVVFAAAVGTRAGGTVHRLHLHGHGQAHGSFSGVVGRFARHHKLSERDAAIAGRQLQRQSDQSVRFNRKKFVLRWVVNTK